MLVKSSLLLALALMLASADAKAAGGPPIVQNTTGTIKGVVTDPLGAVIASAEIRATELRTGQTFNTRTNAIGAFELSGLPFGEYSIEGTAQGFMKSYVKVYLSKESPESPHNPQLQVAMGEVTIDVHMQVGEATLSCVVCSYTYFSLPYTDLPLRDRDPQQLLTLKPEVIEHKGEFSVAGRRTTSRDSSLNGVNVRDGATGRFMVSLGLDSVSEFTSGYDGGDATSNDETKRGSSDQLSVETRTGSNPIHARTFWYSERPGLGANNFFTNRAGLSHDRSIYDTAGGTLGGPLSVPALFSGRDHAFFFVSYERTRDLQETGHQTIAPLSSFIARTTAIQGPMFQSLLARGRFPASDGREGGLIDVDGDGLPDLGDTAFRRADRVVRNLALMHLDFVLTTAVRLNATYADDLSSRNDSLNESAFTPSSPLEASHRGRLFGVRLTALTSPQTVGEFDFAYREGRSSLSGAGSDAVQLVALNSPLGVGSGVPELPEGRTGRALSFTGDLAHVRGAHNLRIGGQVHRREELYASSGLENGRIYYSDILALVSDGRRSVGDPERAIVRAEIAEGPYSQRYRFSDFYGYSSDNWRMSPRFIVTAGLGYNLYSGVVYGDQKSDRNNLAPFASFALGITRSEKVILRGGASIDYAPPLLLPYGELKSTPLYPVATGFARADQIAGTPLPREWIERPGAAETEIQFSSRMRTAHSKAAFLALQHSIGRILILEAAYNSTLGRRLTTTHPIARHTQTGSAGLESGNDSEDSLEVLPIASDGSSNYHSLTLSATSRERRSFIFQAHYTLSKSIDTVSDERFSIFRSRVFGPAGAPPLERGLSDFDRRHRAVGFFQWQLPSAKGLNSRARVLFGEWRLSGIVTLQSGPHVSIYSSGEGFGGRGDFNGDGTLNDRLAYVGVGSIGNAVRSSASAADGYFDASSFAPPDGDGRVALGRNVLPAPGYASVDLALQKSFPLGDSRIEVRAEAFNVTNRVNFAPPITDYVSADFGRSRQAGPARNIRLAVRYSF